MRFRIVARQNGEFRPIEFTARNKSEALKIMAHFGATCLWVLS